MADISKLIRKVAAEERASREQPFLAPCVHRGVVRVRVGGLVESYRPRPSGFEGWAVFKARDTEVAEVQEEAELHQIEEYTKRLPKMRWRLAARLRRKSWLAVPVSVGDARQRFANDRPTIIRLVAEASRFDVVTACFDGATWWHVEPDWTADPIAADNLRQAFSGGTTVDELGWKGMTPEMHRTFQFARQPWLFLAQPAPGSSNSSEEAPPVPPTDEARLQAALKQGGGRLLGYQDQEEHWMVEWETAEGERQHSAISKRDFTVISAGICLDGHDQNFDLQSLVGVVEKADYDW